MSKVYLHYEGVGAPQKTLKLSIPKKWMENKCVSDVIELFTDSYNKANPEHAIDKELCHLDADGEKIYSNDIIGTVLQDRYDYHIKPGPYAKAAKAAVEAATGPPKLLCKNYGCGKRFTEEENGPEACRHHVAPPLFHDCIKGWTCCKEKKAYDWEEFQKIEGCAVGPHCTTEQSLFAPSPNAPDELRTDMAANAAAAAAAPTTVSAAPAAPALKSISAYNEANPDAATASASAVKTITGRKSTRKPDGTAKCLNKGCQKTFIVAENKEGACQYHAGQPIFHDAAKFWSCCPNKKCYDFEEFMQVPGCAHGKHDDGHDEI
jgi:hypothetical protein